VRAYEIANEIKKLSEEFRSENNICDEVGCQECVLNSRFDEKNMSWCCIIEKLRNVPVKEVEYSATSQHENICKRLTKTYKNKNKDYGDSFVETRKEFDNAILIRLTDKFSRLKTLIKNQNQMVKDESLIDTLLDMANYCIMEVMEIEKEVAQ